MRWLQYCWIRWQLFWLPHIGIVRARSTLGSALGAMLLVALLMFLDFSWWLSLLIVAAFFVALLLAMYFFLHYVEDDDFEVDIHARIAQQKLLLEAKLERMVAK